MQFCIPYIYIKKKTLIINYNFDTNITTYIHKLNIYFSLNIFKYIFTQF